jgi:hypothetical protein
MKNGAQLRPIGVIRSVLKARTDAPKQGSEGAPDAWLEVSRPLPKASMACASVTTSSS